MENISARLTFSQVGIFVSAIVYLAVRGGLVMLSINGPLWFVQGGWLSIALPIIPVIVMGFTACCVSYAYSYVGLWMMDNDLYLLGVATIFLSVIIAPGIFAAYSWFGFEIIT
ncbi:MAG: hypothetical protein KGY80_05495 [Candidatus Thorarchaeota archaeon]|nr:hypothetical protein [Candidatus Thorarchaeota archaeon]